MASTPLVSVAMPVYNSERYVDEAIESVLNQSFGDFELLIIDDGSTDETPHILKRYEQADDRVRVVWQEHRGIPYTRNRAWESAQGTYLAWADSDDLCLPQRLEKQVAFLERHKDIAVCGGAIETFGNSGITVGFYPTDDASIRCHLLFRSPIANPTAMIRRSVFLENNVRYDLQYPTSSDYDVWTQISAVSKLANLPEVLVRYRLHKDQVSKGSESSVYWTTAAIQQNELRKLGIDATAQELRSHGLAGKPGLNLAEVNRLERWLRRILQANQHTSVYPEPQFTQLIVDHWHRSIGHSSDLGLRLWLLFARSPLTRTGHIKLIEQLKILKWSISRSFSRLVCF